MGRLSRAVKDVVGEFSCCYTVKKAHKSEDFEELVWAKMGKYVRNKLIRVCRLWAGRSYKIKRVPVHGTPAWEQGREAGQQRG